MIPGSKLLVSGKKYELSPRTHMIAWNRGRAVSRTFKVDKDCKPRKKLRPRQLAGELPGPKL